MALVNDGALIYVPTRDFWDAASLATATRRENRMLEYPHSERYQALPAPHYLVNGIRNDWDVKMTVTNTIDDTAIFPSLGLQMPPSFVDGRMVHMCLTLREPSVLKESSKTTEKGTSMNTMPICIMGQYLEGQSEAPNLASASVGGLEVQWIARMNGKVLHHERYSAYSGSLGKKGFRPARLVFQDATFAQLFRDHRAGTQFDTDEIYFAHPASTANRSQLYNVFQNLPDAQAVHGKDKPKKECHRHAKGQSLAVCGNPNCFKLGVVEAGKVNMQLMKRCSRCTVVYYCSSECQKKHWTMHKALCSFVKDTMV